MATVDTLRLLFTYTIALVVVLGGGAILFLSGDNPATSDTRVVVAGFIGSALTFVFGSEVQTRTARQAATQTLASVTAANGSNPNIPHPAADGVT